MWIRSIRLSLGGQLALLLGVTMLALQAASSGIHLLELHTLAAQRARDRAPVRLLQCASAMLDVPESVRDKLAAAFSDPALVMRLEEQSAVHPSDTVLSERREAVGAWLREMGLEFHSFAIAQRTVYLPEGRPPGVRYAAPAVLSLAEPLTALLSSPRVPGWVTQQPGERPEDPRYKVPTQAFIFSLRFGPDSEYLNMYTIAAAPPRSGTILKIWLTGVASIGLLIIAVLIGRRLMWPFRRLAGAAEMLGRGERVTALPETGTYDVRNTTAAFNRMAERVVQAAEYQVALLRSLGHDLRGPMAAMRTLLRRAEPEETREQIEARLSRAETIVSSIMTFTRATLRDGAIERTDLTALVEAVVDEYAELDNDVSFEATDPIFVRCRFNAIERVMRNVIDNGLKYGRRVRVSLYRMGTPALAVIRFDDDGPGIPAEMLEEVFEPFRRISDDPESPQGSGLGLAIVKSIVVDHGGTVTLTNREEGGLRVEIRLPI